MKRLALVVLAPLLVAAPVRAGERAADDEPPLVTAEVHAGYGMAIGGGAGRAAVRGSPLLLGVRAAVAFRDQPRASGFAGLRVETLDRTGVGGEAGISLEPSSRVRLRAGGVAMVAPYVLWGAYLGGGRCSRAGGARLCLDVDADVMIGGSDLPDGAAVMQIVLAVGIGFDAR